MNSIRSCLRTRPTASRLQVKRAARTLASQTRVDAHHVHSQYQRCFFTCNQATQLPARPIASPISIHERRYATPASQVPPRSAYLLSTQPLPESATKSLTTTFQPFEIDVGGEKKVVHARHLYGFEGFVCYMSECGNGFSQLSVTVSTKISQPLDASRFIPAAKRAWIRCRHLVPGIAARTFGIPRDDFPDEAAQRNDEDIMINKAHYLVYEVPEPEEVTKWAQETVKFHEKGEFSLKEFDVELSKDWWKSGDGRFNIELHIAKGKGAEQGDWLFSLHGLHHSIDGAGGFMVLDEFLKFFKEDLNGASSQALSSLSWGKELERLPACAATVLEEEVKKTVASKTTEPTKSSDEKSKDEQPESASAPPTPPVPFFRPFGPIPQATTPEPSIPVTSTSTFPLPRHPYTFPNAAHKYRLSRSMTAAFKKACKARGRKVTAAVDAILVLSEVEETLKTALEHISENGGRERWNETKKLFEEAPFVIVPMKFIDMRSSLPADKSSFSCQQSTPLFSLSYTSHIHGMQSVREAISIHEDNTVPRIVREDAEKFWNGAVKDSAEAWKVGKPSNEQFVAAEAAMTASLPGIFQPALYNIPGIFSSSPGDFDRFGHKLGLLKQWNETLSGPLVADDAKVDFRVKEITPCVRMHSFPCLVAETFLYDGQLTFYCFGSGGFYTDEQMKRWAKRIEGWIEKAVGADELVKAKTEEGGTGAMSALI